MNVAAGELPDGWERVRLGELGMARTQNMDPSKYPDTEFELWSVPSFPSGEPETQLGSDIGSTKQQVAPGDVLLCKINPRINRVWVVEEKGELDQIASSEWIVFRNGEIDPCFLMHRLREQNFRDRLCAEVSGVGGSLTRARPQTVKLLEVEIAPLAEQRRIVAKIEALQERSRKARELLTEVGPLLEQFRQSLLAAAFRGDLTADWRKQNPNVEPATDLLARIRTERRERWEQSELAKYEAKGKQPPKGWKDKYKEPENFGAAELDTLSPLPHGWCWTRFANFCSVQGGFAFRSKDYTDRGVPLIRIGDLDDGAVKIDDSTARLPSEFADIHSQFRLSHGDVLIAMSGATTGKMAVFECNEVALLNQRVGRFLPHAPNLIHGPFLRGLVESIVEDIRGRAYGGAQPNISPTEIASTPVAIPPFEEQIQIAELLNVARTVAVSIEKECSESESALTNLDQSILAKAFRGELVSQDPNDEPASVLLERVRETRAHQKEKTKGKGKKTTRSPKRNTAMTKSRFDDDVKGQPYLTKLMLSSTGKPALTAEELFQIAQLSLPDFYKQLDFEVTQQMLVEREGRLEPADAT